MTSRDEKTSWGFDKTETGKKTYKGKLRKHQQFAFEFRERGPGLRIEIVPTVIGCIGGGMK